MNGTDRIGGMKGTGREKAMPAASGIGVTTLFVVLLILSLTVFAVLTFASAQADLRLSAKNAEMVAKYYEADSLGMAVSAEASGFWPAGAPAPDEAARALLEGAIAATPGVEDASVLYDAGAGFTVSYGIAVDARLTLRVSLALPEGGVCQIQSWRVDAEEPEITEETPGLWLGGAPDR
jgi:hypothetical protein